MVDEDRLDDLMLAWDEARKKGLEITAEELCQQDPELLDEVKRGICALKYMSRFIDLGEGDSDADLMRRSTDEFDNRKSDETQLNDCTLSIEEFSTAIVDSGLLNAAQLQEFRETHCAGETLSFARQLVSEKKLTQFQAGVLLDGRDQPLFLDRYILLDEIGSGGMGAVFKALHRQMDRVVALKILPKAAIDSPDKVSRFHREVLAAAKLDHPNIVTAFDAHESKGIHYLVMSYIDGCDLAETVRNQGPLSVRKAVNCIVQAAKGLGHAHEQGIIHRDVKPANLLLDKQGTVKVLDMGLARFESADVLHDDPTSPELTQAGLVMGTFTYIAPEQALDTRNADARSDIYSLGCTFYYLLTGNPVFEENTMMKTIMAHQHSDAPALVQDSNDINVVFQKMVAKNPSARYQSMADVISAFESVVEQSDEITETSDDSQKSNPSTSTLLDTNRVTESNPALQRPRHRWPLLAACSIAFAGLVLAYGTFLRVRTSEGIITLVIDQPELTGAIVSVDGEKKITITTGEGKEPIEVVADKNTHTLKVTKGGFETFTKQFTLNAGGEKTIRVHLEPAKLAKNTTPSTEAPSVNSAVGADDSAIQAVQQAGNFAWPTDQPAAAIGPYNGKQAERFQQQWAKHLGVEVEATNTLGMKFRVIPAAEFVMGSSEEEIKKLMKETEKLPDDYYKRIPDEGPQHNVVLTKPFAFAIHEVTRGQFRQFVDSTNYTTDAERDGTGGHGYKGKQWISAPEFHWDMNPGFETAQTDDHPVLNVSWNDAVAFCIWLSKKEGLTYRLPTEAEWEFACRAGSSGQFSPNGDGSRLSEYAWHAIEGGASTKPVGTKRANALGLHDLHGHVWEWCADNYGLYKSSPVTDPQGSANEASRVLRGGGFTNHAMLVRTTNRKLQPPTYRSCNIGFRPVREFKPSP